MALCEMLDIRYTLTLLVLRFYFQTVSPRRLSDKTYSRFRRTKQFIHLVLTQQRVSAQRTIIMLARMED